MKETKIKLCKKCGEEFEALYKDQVYCQNPCNYSGKKTIEEANRNWMKPKKEKKKLFHI